MDKNIIELFSFMGFSSIIIGIIFFIFGKKDNERQQSIALGAFAGGLALIVMTYFKENPEFREWSVAKVALLIIGGIITIIKIINKIK